MLATGVFTLALLLAFADSLRVLTTAKLAGDHYCAVPGASAKGTVMSVESCIPIIPRRDLEKSLRLWIDGLGFSMSSQMRKDDKLIFCMLRKDNLCFMLNQRAGTAVKPKDYEGIRLYWAPKDIQEIRERSKSLGYSVSELEHRDYGQTEFFLTDDDDFSRYFGVPT